MNPSVAWSVLLLGGGLYLATPYLRRHFRQKKYTRGRQLGTAASKTADGLPWGTIQVPKEAATRHFLAVGTTGSGKSLLQRRLMRQVLADLKEGSDARVLIFDAKNDAIPFLEKVGVSCPIRSLNPFESRSKQPQAVAWDVAADITSAARALNLAASLIPSEKGGNNQYFTDAARQVLTGVIESFIRLSPKTWTFSDLVFATLSLERVKEILNRDENGRDVLANFLAEERTAYQVFTTIVSRMAYFRPVAALWQRAESKLSLRDWLNESSVLLLGTNSTARIALDAINEIMFRVLVEEIDEQSDTDTRRTWIWIDEARLSGPLLSGPMIPYLCVKGRSRGVCLVLSFQDIEGFREAAGPRVAHEIVAQCSYKALLRTESEESATWSSRLVGQYETLDLMRSDPTMGGRSATLSEQVARRDAVIASEFYTIPLTTRESGLTGYFVGPDVGVVRGRIDGRILDSVVTPSHEFSPGLESRAESDQWLEGWKGHDRKRLGLERTKTKAVKTQVRKQRLKSVRQVSG